MLYDRWRRTARANSHLTALLEPATGRRWTFSELFNAGQKQVQGPGAVDFPQGAGVEFILGVLAGWREHRVVCPLEAGQNAPPMRAGLPAGIAHLKMTSATTGQARLVAFTAEQLAADAQNITQTMGLRPDWPNLAVISLAHSYGFSNLVLPLLLQGIPLILVGSALPEALRQAATLQPQVTLAAVPALWRAWHEAEAIPRNVQLAISAGAPLPLALEQAVFAARALKLHNFYGSSECGGIAYDGALTPRSDGACAGAPLHQVKLSSSAAGCLEVRSAAVAETYWPDPSPDLGDGLFRTRDVGRLVDGQVYLSGRATDEINVAGRKVLPETIEAVLAAHPQVRACLAFGVPADDAQRGDTIVACIAGNKETGESVRQFALSHLPAWQVPREWWFVESLETNGRGKLSRAEWRKRYLETARASSPLSVTSPRTTS